MLLRNVEIVFALPISCNNCGIKSQTEFKRINLLNVESTDIDEIIKRQNIGTSFPVGWASYHSTPHDIYLCSDCLSQINNIN